MCLSTTLSHFCFSEFLYIPAAPLLWNPQSILTNAWLPGSTDTWVGGMRGSVSWPSGVLFFSRVLLFHGSSPLAPWPLFPLPTTKFKVVCTVALSAAVFPVLSLSWVPFSQVCSTTGRASSLSLEPVFPLVWAVCCKRDGDRCVNFPGWGVLPASLRASPPCDEIKTRKGCLSMRPFLPLGLQLGPVYHTPGT